MYKSIFRKYFLTMSAVIIISIFSLWVILLLISSEIMNNYAKNAMSEQFSLISSETRQDALLRKDFRRIQDRYENNCSNDYFEIILLDEKGRILINTHSLEEDKINIKALNNVGEEPNFFKSTLYGYYNVSHYIMSKRIHIDNSDYYLLLTSLQEYSWTSSEHIIRVLTVFISVILVVILIVAYLSAKKAIRPVHEICEISKEYSKGDFSKRIDVGKNKQLGSIALALNEMAETLSNLESMRSSFITNVSHEFKTPITSIGGFVDGILDGTIPLQEQKKYLKIVSQETKRLTRLVTSMMNMAKIESHNIRLNMQRFNLISLTVKCLCTFEEQVKNKNIEVVGLENLRARAYADFDLIYQVVYNLIENAIKFTEEGGYISFNIKNTPTETYFSIRNSGAGISEEDIQLIFDKFYKTDKSRSQDNSGVGLGLYLSSLIIGLHNGKIKVNSVIDDYTEFYFSIPYKKNQEKGS